MSTNCVTSQSIHLVIVHQLAESSKVFSSSINPSKRLFVHLTLHARIRPAVRKKTFEKLSKIRLTMHKTILLKNY